MIAVPEDLEPALKAQAKTHGASPEGYLRDILQRELAPSLEPESPLVPFETGRGILAKYGPAPSFEEFEENRREMFKNFGEEF